MATMMAPPAAAIERWRSLVKDKADGRPIDEMTAFVAAQMVKRDVSDLDVDAKLVRQRQDLFAEAARGDEAREHLRDINTRQIALNQKRFAQDYADARTQHELNVAYDQWESVRTRARDALNDLRRNALRLYPERAEAIDAISARIADTRQRAARLNQQATDHDVKATNIETVAAGYGRIDTSQRKQVKAHRSDADQLREQAAELERGIPDLQKALDDATAKLLDP